MYIDKTLINIQFNKTQLEHIRRYMTSYVYELQDSYTVLKYRLNNGLVNEWERECKKMGLEHLEDEIEFYTSIVKNIDEVLNKEKK